MTHVTGACRSQSQMCLPWSAYIPYPWLRASFLGCVHVDDGLAQNRRKHARVRYEKQVQVATLSGMT
jgi:hypothetical protein